MEKVEKLANLYVATLRAIYLVEQFDHWHSRGTGFYGDHLLFQRLYESAQENADGAAEKMIGVFGESAVDYKTQCELIEKITAKYANLEKEPLKQALAIEKDFIQYSKDFYNTLEKMGELTLGVDDFLMATSSKREESVYLLQQALLDNSKG